MVEGGGISGRGVFELFTMEGKLMKSGQLFRDGQGQARIRTGEIPTGMYVLKIDGAFVRKMVKW